MPLLFNLIFKVFKISYFLNYINYIINNSSYTGIEGIGIGGSFGSIRVVEVGISVGSWVERVEMGVGSWV